MATLLVRDRDDIRANPSETARRPQKWDVVSVFDDAIDVGAPVPPFAAIVVPGLSVDEASAYLEPGDGRARQRPYPVTEAMRVAIKSFRVARVTRPWYVRLWAFIRRLWA